jgi:16S rRNA (adenine1518-N6/adenine1519-N6)-dimethyltransferase
MKEKFQTKKSLGQHFLTTEVVPGWMCDAAKVAEGERVLEIGPGTGALTRVLLARGARVIALEADTRAIAVLSDTFEKELKNGTLSIHHTDVRTLDLGSIPDIHDHEFIVVANIPYYLSGLLFRTMLESDIQPNRLVYLVQKEVAKRICTEKKRGEKESLLSLSIKVFGKPTYIKTVSKGHFSPAPKVDSAIILIDEIGREHFTTLPKKFFFDLLHLGFGQKRKQLLSNLSKQYPKESLVHSFSTLGLPLTTRAEDIELKSWLALAEDIYKTLST